MENSLIDYLIIGHATHDLTDAGPVLGGTAVYAGQTAQALGCRTALVTSVAPNVDLAAGLPGLTITNIPAEATTTFINQDTPAGRRQTIRNVARKITPADIPDAWRRAAIVHLAPVAQEVEPAIITLFSRSLAGITLQGWLRCWGEDGRVFPCRWPQAEAFMPLAAAVIVSEEDVTGPAMIAQFRQWARLLVVTQGRAGCAVYCQDEERTIPAPRVNEVDATGAGDIFAAAFLIRLYQTAGALWEAADFANQIAAQSVAQPDLAAKIKAIKSFYRQL